MSIDRRSPHDLSQDIREPAAIYDSATATDPYGIEAGWIPDVEVLTVPYSIRIPVPAGTVTCPRCGGRFLAVGPTGFAGEQPICDLCLLDGSQPLGLLLALAAVVRAFGSVEPTAGGDYPRASEELAAFARVYARAADRSGPPRPFPLSDLEV